MVCERHYECDVDSQDAEIDSQSRSQTQTRSAHKIARKIATNRVMVDGDQTECRRRRSAKGKRGNGIGNQPAQIDPSHSPFSRTSAELVLTTTSLPEIAHGRELAVKRLHSVPPVIESRDGLGSFGFPFVPRVDVAH
jgi:hypothetical protein